MPWQLYHHPEVDRIWDIYGIYWMAVGMTARQKVSGLSVEDARAQISKPGILRPSGLDIPNPCPQSKDNPKPVQDANPKCSQARLKAHNPKDLLPKSRPLPGPLIGNPYMNYE